MMRHTFCGTLFLLACLVSTDASAQGVGDWSVASAQGYLEHIVRNGPGNSFNISCNVSANPDTIGQPSLFVEIVGKAPAAHTYVDVFALDDVYRLPVDYRGEIGLDCSYCAGVFRALWGKIRKSNAIVVQYQNGQNVSFKTRGAAKALSEKPCKS